MNSGRFNQGSFFLYLDRTGFKITVENENLDPYLDSNFSPIVSVSRYKYYGIEANCSLQTTNVAVDGGDYIPLSETALQIPIEWDSLTGEWNGAQSLTGLESLSGSKEFAKFDLTADVTTGTWTMNCSGIASDIEGNKIALNPAEITINLDDQIHGGANVISGKISIPNTSDYSGVVVTITLNGRQIEVTTQEDGTFEFDRLVAGDYSVHVYSDQYVAACTSLTLNTDNTNPVLNIPMYAGDINNDGGVDIGDFSLLSSLFGLNSDDENYNPLADLNHDNVINIQDLSILGSHFGTDHCEVSPQ
ncbi:carboxypeptidase regulatory-like domain-containing protein [Pseudomonas sp. HK3]